VPGRCRQPALRKPLARVTPPAEPRAQPHPLAAASEAPAAPDSRVEIPANPRPGGTCNLSGGDTPIALIGRCHGATGPGSLQQTTGGLQGDADGTIQPQPGAPAHCVRSTRCLRRRPGGASGTTNGSPPSSILSCPWRQRADCPRRRRWRPDRTGSGRRSGAARRDDAPPRQHGSGSWGAAVLQPVAEPPAGGL
jgi:hypothetical protein